MVKKIILNNAIQKLIRNLEVSYRSKRQICLFKLTKAVFPEEVLKEMLSKLLKLTIYQDNKKSVVLQKLKELDISLDTLKTSL